MPIHFSKIPLKVLVGILFCLIGLQGFTQNISTDIAGEILNANNCSDKVFVHTDKSFYMPGEIIWFKVYCLDVTTGSFADVSKVASVEILSRQHVAILQAKIELKDGKGNGSFIIPQTITSDNFLLRGYTSQMQNFSPDFYFQKTITIINAAQRPDGNIAKSTPLIDAQFFPEGGDLLEAIESKVGFRVVDQQGHGLQATGYIISNNIDTVARFSTLHFGIGSFKFTPVTGNHYKAMIETKEGKSWNVDLPKIDDQGYAMQLNEIDQAHLEIAVSKKGNEDEKKNYLAVKSGPKMDISEGYVHNGKSFFTVDKRILKDGITTFTLLNEQHQPVCERLYFKKPQTKISMHLSTLSEEYATRDKVQLQLSDTVANGGLIGNNMSLAVYLIDSLQSPDTTDVVSWYWLTSELKGNVENPGYYLSESVDNASIDNLMLTHGWRRVSVTKPGKNSTALLPEYEGQIVKAKLTNKFSKLPLANTIAYLTIPGQRYIFTNGISNASGEVLFPVPRFYGNAQAVIQVNSRLDSNCSVEVVNSFSNEFAAGPLPPLSISSALKNSLTNRYISAQVQTMFASDSINRFRKPFFSDTTSFYGTPDKAYLLDNYTRFPTMEEVLHEYVEYISLRRAGKSIHVSVLDIPTKNNFDEEPLSLLDGVPVFNFDKIITTNPLKVKSIEVVARRFFTGNLVNSGILSFSTYNGDLADYELDPGAVVTDLCGYQVTREFFSPVYDNTEKLQSPVADSRNLLYWAPDVTTDQNGKKQMVFYTSDMEGKFAIVLQGFSADGHPVSAIKTFSVKK